MVQTKQPYSIFAAPSKLDLMTALFRNSEDPTRVKFGIQPPMVNGFIGPATSVEATINGVTREDGSGESWIIEGHLFLSPGRSHAFKGWYRTTDRMGWMEWDL